MCFRPYTVRRADSRLAAGLSETFNEEDHMTGSMLGTGGSGVRIHPIQALPINSCAPHQPSHGRPFGESRGCKDSGGFLPHD